MLRRFFRILLAIGFVVAGLNHFRDPAFYMAMMPPILPWHLGLIYVSGVFEVLGGIGVLVPVTRRLAGWGLIALLVAVFPANIYGAIAHVQLPGTPVPPIFMWIRLPFQALFIAWVYFTTLSKSADRAR